jgi:hypothetical protein
MLVMVVHSRIELQTETWNKSIYIYVTWSDQAPAHYVQYCGSWAHWDKLHNAPNIMVRREAIPWQ